MTCPKENVSFNKALEKMRRDPAEQISLSPFEKNDAAAFQCKAQ